MKNITFLLLACEMFASLFAQSETEKWVITPVPNMKGVLGRLDINFPADVERNILIYQQTDNKFITSVSRNDKTYNIAPGVYRFTLTNVPVDNVPIQKGHETRLRAGFLNIVSEGVWFLHDETKTKAYTSGNKPKNLPLPVGKYQVKLGGQFYPVVIKDGETVEDYTPVGIKDQNAEGKLNFNDNNPLTTLPDVSEKWIIYTASTIVGMGTLNISFPEGVKHFISVSHDGTSLYYGYDSTNKATLDLAPGTYKFCLNQMCVNVPIIAFRETKLKTGFLKVTFDDYWKLKNYNGNYSIDVSAGHGPGKVVLPPGNYTLYRAPSWNTFDVPSMVSSYSVRIKDGETVTNGEKK